MEYTFADKKEINQLTELRIAYIREDQKEISADAEAKLKAQLPVYFENHLNKDIFAFIAKDGKVVAGVVMLLVIEKPANPHFIHGRTADVLSVYTRPEYRHQGICLNLVKLAQNFATEKQIDKIELKATQDGYSVYKKAGFVDENSPYKSMVFRPAGELE